VGNLEKRQFFSCLEISWGH